jgi:hypothetical protein
MARTAAPVTPGADTAAAAPVTPGGEVVVLPEGVKPSDVAAAPDDEVAKLRAELAEMKALLGQVARQNQPAPAVVKLPTMAEVLKAGKPDSPVLTSEGWYVPAVLLSQRQAG